jgi:hypothetical protein
MTDESSMQRKYLLDKLHYLAEALRAVVTSGDLMARHCDEFDDITIGRAAYDSAVTALRKYDAEGGLAFI